MISFRAFRLSIGFLSAALVFPACSNAPQNPVTVEAGESTPWMSEFAAVTADAEVAPTSSTDTTEPLERVNDFQLGIPRAAIRRVDMEGKVLNPGYEFLLSATTTEQAGAPTSRSLAGRVVYFQEFPDGIDLYESVEGLTTSDQLPARRLLAKFPIVTKLDEKGVEGRRITIDFNAGMKFLFAVEWISIETKFEKASRADILPIFESRVYKVSASPKRAAIHQSIQVRPEDNKVLHLDVKYFLEPFRKSDFASKVSVQNNHARFFTTLPILEKTSGISRVLMARFDITKPIVFHYSANTPEEFVDAVKDGILYWNRAFGKDIVQAEKAPEGMTAPDPDHNIIQWVPWDNAGFAYAGLNLNPRTGETLHGQVYMTSVFAVKGVQRARQLLRLYQNRVKATPTKHAEFQIRFLGDSSPWASIGSCDSGLNGAFADQFAEGLSAVLSLDNVTDARVLEVSRNYVRETIAHEVGHVLGLRHNFAGSIKANITPHEVDERLIGFLVEGKLTSAAGVVPATSTMEYTEWPAAVLVGQVIAEGKEVFSHDKSAIRYGYFNEEGKDFEKELFCTDDDTEEIPLFGKVAVGDCERFDPPGDPLAGAAHEIFRNIESLPSRFIEEYVNAKSPENPVDLLPLEKVSPPTKPLIDKLFVPALGRFARWFTVKRQFVVASQEFPYSSEVNEEEVLAYRWKDLEKRLSEAGGAARLLSGFLPLKSIPSVTELNPRLRPGVRFDKAELVAQVEKLLKSRGYKSFIGTDGKEHSFTAAEMEIIQKNAVRYFKVMEEMFIQTALAAFSRLRLELGPKVNGVNDGPDFTAGIQRVLAGMAREIILTKDKTELRGKLKTTNIVLNPYLYSTDTRKLALGLLAKPVGPHPFWSETDRKGITAALSADLENTLLISSQKAFEETDLSPALRDWFTVQQTLIALLRM